MSTVTIPAHAPAAWRDAASFVWRAWAGTTRREWAWVAAIGLVIALVELPHRVDMIQKLGWHPLPAITETLLPLAAVVPMFLGWVLADRGDDARQSRHRRLIYALLAAGAVTASFGVLGWYLSGAADLWQHYAAKKGASPKSVGLVLIAEYINTVIVGGMAFAVAEVFRQRCLTQLAFESAARQQVTLEHQLLQSRLAAMQAQVEPRFLFDTLVDIERLYERNPHQAAENLDRLIAYLRAALPLLRESGSSVGAELELVQSYLAVVTSLRGGRPHLVVQVADECRQARFYPMLLLPLVQRAVRAAAGSPPEAIAIDVRRDAQDTVVAVRIPTADGCAEDPELARVRERLAGLYGGAASLHCAESDGVTELRMRVPFSVMR